MRATALSFGASPEATRAFILSLNHEIQMVEARWGSVAPDGETGVSHVPPNGHTTHLYRCLGPVSKFQVNRNDMMSRVALEDGNGLYLAGRWRQALGQRPKFFGAITGDANGGVARYQVDQSAIIRRNRHLERLGHVLSEDEMLVTRPIGLFVSKRESAPQQQLAI